MLSVPKSVASTALALLFVGWWWVVIMSVNPPQQTLAQELGLASESGSDESVESVLKQILERLDAIEKKLAIERAPVTQLAVVPMPPADGFVTELRDGKSVKIAVDEPLLEAEIEGRLPGWAQTVYNEIRKMKDPERTYRQRQLRMMLKLPEPKDPTRQQVLDALPKNDPLYNFTSKEWDAINATDEEWVSSYGSSPARRPSSK